jgi:hypothetical protein
MDTDPKVPIKKYKNKESSFFLSLNQPLGVRSLSSNATWERHPYLIKHGAAGPEYR